MADIVMPDWSEGLFSPCRYKVLHGGRGSGKSYAIADALLLQAVESRHRVLCGREYQTSIKDSVYQLLKDRAADLGLEKAFGFHRDRISAHNGGEFLFIGLRRSVDSIRSIKGITRFWAEEAQSVSEESWRTLIPSIREEGSEIWVSYNPHLDTDATYQRFQASPDPGIFVREVNFWDNPFFPQVMEDDRRRDEQRLDGNTYAHIWEGRTLQFSEAQVLHGKWRVETFEPGGDWDGPYHGLDFGFGQDPMAATRTWRHNGRLFVEMESGGRGVENDELRGYLEADIPGISQYEVLADNSRPETISYLRRHGMSKIRAASKWAGSVADGVSYLRGHKEIVIHPRCRQTSEEARLYSHKTTKSGAVLPEIVDAYNHYIDSIRYGHDRLIRSKGLLFADVGSAR